MIRPRPHNLPSAAVGVVAALLALPLFPSLSQGQLAVGVAGPWVLQVLPVAGGGPSGPSLPPDHETVARHATLTVAATNGAAAAWRIDVRCETDQWPAGATLAVRRTGPGLGPGTIREGTQYLVVGAEDRTFLYGTGSRSHIPLQLRLTGLPPHLRAGTYTARLVYTVVDLQ